MREKVGLGELITAVWLDKATVFFLAGVFAFFGYLIAQLLPDQYRAQALVAPVDRNESRATPFQQELGGLAAIAGVSLNAAAQDDSELAIALLRSRSFLSRFIATRDIAPYLLAVDYWDEDSRKVVIDTSRYDVAGKRWLSSNAPSKNAVPTEEQLFRALQQRIEVMRVPKTGFISVSVTHQSPVTAKLWVDWLIADINERVRSRDVEEAREAIAFLRGQASENSFADLDQVFFELIQSQMQRMMLANVRSEYVFNTVDPSYAPENPFTPNRLLLVLLGLVVGISLALAFVLIKNLIRRD